MNRELRVCLPGKPRIHERTVARTLGGMLFRLKVANYYANWFMGHAMLHHSTFVDECSYNIWTTRSQDRARRGERAYSRSVDSVGKT